MNTFHPGLSLSNRDFSLILSHQQPARVIISVPHDCLLSGDFSGLFQKRQCGTNVRDLYVWPIVADIVRICLDSETRVDAIRFLMSRAYIDANRALFQEENLNSNTSHETALDDQLLLPLYQNYHRELQQLLERSMREFGTENILLIDLHGFKKQPRASRHYDLILGTAHRETIRHGNIDSEFAEFMRQKSYEVFLPDRQPASPEGDLFSAGQIVRCYAEKYRINAMQVEVASIFREKDAEGRGQKLARDMAEFLSTYYR
jgi:N-formylglutamate amidohydrolase